MMRTLPSCSGVSYIPLKDTGFFSALVNDYVQQKDTLSGLYNFAPNDAGLAEAIAQRAAAPVDRPALVAALYAQYEGYELTEAVAANIAALASEHTFTITTAHQPNLLTGYAYFIYKIMHAVKLAQHLAQLHPDKKFVPVYYMGTEDDDLQELGFFRFNEHNFRWDTPQTGAVGRMKTDDLGALMEAFLKVVGPPNTHTEHLVEVLKKAYLQHDTIAAATRYVVHTFLGKYGVVVLDPDSASLKQAYIPIIKAELFAPKAYEYIAANATVLQAHYKTQAYARPINFFYLKDAIRARIERRGEEWMVVGTQISWDEAALHQEIELHPERFSPNVILRGLFQETVLPNVAFIGGGSEVAYWFQLKEIFDHYGVFYPTIILRQSVQFLSEEAQQLQAQLHLNDTELFTSTETLVKQFVKTTSTNDLEATDEWMAIKQAMQTIRDKAQRIDATLQRSVDAALAKMNHQVNIVEKKMYKAEKHNLSVVVNRVYKLKGLVFPNQSLQERYYTFMPQYIAMGDAYFDTLLEYTLPYGDEFLMVKM